MFLDAGIEETKNFILVNLKEEIENASKHVGEKDHKTVLQEKLQVHKGVHIEYKIVSESGPDHNKTFTAVVMLNGKILAKGIGKSKKTAEMDAAKNVIETNQF